MKFDGDDPVAEVDEARARVAPDDALPILRGFQDFEIARRRRQAVVAEPAAAFAERLAMDVRHSAVIAKRGAVPAEPLAFDAEQLAREGEATRGIPATGDDGQE